MFEVGETFRRKELHARFNGQIQGGISTPAEHKVILIFTGETGAQYGYKDGWNEDGKTFQYTGEGQRGDMTFVRGNRAIRDHEKDGKEIHLFANMGNGFVRYEGQLRCRGFHIKPAPDLDFNIRKAIVFELERVGIK